MQPWRKKLSDLAMCATQHHELLKNCCSSLLLQKKKRLESNIPFCEAPGCSNRSTPKNCNKKEGSLRFLLSEVTGQVAKQL